MAKFLFIGLACLAVCMQMCFAADVVEALNNNIREQLKGYENFLAEDDGSHKADLEKLIKITESALKAETFDEKQNILKGIQANFTPQFNQYITLKLEEFQVNDDIQDAIQFYQNLLDNVDHKAEVEKTIAALENMLKEADLKVKEDKFLSLNKNFSPEFTKFLKENSLPQVNRELQNISEFFENLLVETDLKWKTEITELKKQADAAVKSKSVEEKQKVLFEVSNPKNPDLYQYLQKKFIEHH